MNEERVILSERPEDLKKAVEWGREQQKKIMNLMTPLILKRKTLK